jgi:hypothetical protein
VSSGAGLTAAAGTSCRGSDAGTLFKTPSILAVRF